MHEGVAMIVNGSMVEMDDGCWLAVESLEVGARVRTYPCGTLARIAKTGRRRMSKLRNAEMSEHWPYEVFPDVSEEKRIFAGDDLSPTRVSPKTRIMRGEHSKTDRVMLNACAAASLETRGKSLLCHDLETFSYHFIMLEGVPTFLNVGHVLVGSDAWGPVAML
jgi:hypothetical protein